MGRLSSAFLDRAPDAVRAELAAAEDLEGQLAAMLEGARATWPGIAIDDEVFVSYVAERVASGSALLELRAPDLYLACACARGSAEAIAAFDKTYFGDIDVAAQRVPDLPAVADEVRQVLREKLFVAREGAMPKIVEYAGRSPLRTWLRVVASRAAVDLLRRDRGGVRKNDDMLAELASPLNDPELAYLKERYRRELEAALREAAALLSASDRNLLRHHHTDGLTLDELASRYRVHRVTIARRLGAVREKLAQDTRRVLRERFGIGANDLESLMLLVKSQLDVSLRSLLADNED